MDMIAAAYGCVDESDDEDSNPWASSRVSAKRTIGRDEEISSRPTKKITNRLPTPKLIEYQVPQEVVDDPTQHGNRIRSFAHERGNWASFIYLPWEANSMFLSSVEWITKCFKNNGIELEMCGDFHISLTRTFILRHHWIDGFITSVKKQLNEISRPFQLLGTNVLSVYTNEERNRTFLAINIADSSGILKILTQKIDACMIEYQLPTFYKDASHHVSIAWCLGDKKEEIEMIAVGLKLEIDQISCSMNELRCKIGNLMKRL